MIDNLEEHKSLTESVFQQISQKRPKRQFYLNEEVISGRSECFSYFPELTKPLEGLYQDMKQQFIQKDVRNTVFNDNDNHEENSTNYDMQEVFAFTQQSRTLYETYGEPTCVNSQLLDRRDGPKLIIIGTQQSVIIVMEILRGRVEKVQSIFNVGDHLNKYGIVTTLHVSSDGCFLLCGFDRGDIQVFEIQRKWERVVHIQKCHSSKVIKADFFSIQDGKIISYEAVSVDEQGVVMRLQFNVVRLFDKIMVKERSEKLYENGKCVAEPQNQVQNSNIQKSAWWQKSFFTKSEQQSPQDKYPQTNQYSIDSFMKRFSKENSASEKDSTDDGTKRPLRLIFSALIFLMPNKTPYEKNYAFIGLQYIDRIEILRVDPENIKDCQEIYTLKRNNLLAENDLSNADMCCGKGYFKQSTQTASFLMVRWGECFHLVKCMNIDGELELVEGAFFKLDTGSALITKSSFISTNLIYFSRDDCKIGFIHTTQFEFQGVDDLIQNDAQNRQRYLSKEEIQAQKALKLIDLPKNKFTSNEISDIDREKAIIVVLNNGNLFINRLKSWDQFLNDLIQKNQWFQALFNGMLIYQGKVKLLANVPTSLPRRQEEMKESLQKMAFTYILFLLKPLDIAQEVSHFEKEKQIRLVFEYLIKTENLIYLLTVVKDIFRDLNQQKLFFHCLETFIIQKLVDRIPENFLYEFVDYYKETKNKDMVATLILQLDTIQSDIAILLKICVDLQLLRAMIYLCNKSGDYLTPLIKLMVIFEQKFGNDKVGTQIDKQKNAQERQRVGMNALAYLHTCFKGRSLSGDLVSRGHYTDMLRGIVSYIFIEENLRSLMLIDFRVTLEIVYLLFKGKGRSTIIKKPEYFKLQLEQECQKHISMFTNLQDNINLKNMLLKIRVFQFRQDLFEKISFHKELDIHFKLFFSRVILEDFLAFSVEFMVNLVENILNDKEFFSTAEKYKNFQTQEIICVSEANKNAFLICLLDKMINQLDSSVIQSLYIQASTLEYHEVAAYLLFNDQKEVQAFQILLKSQNEQIKKYSFEYLEAIFLFEKKNQDLINQFKQIVLDNISNLISIDESGTYRFIKTHFQNQEKNIVKALTLSPKFQLDYITNIMKTYDPREISEELKLEYLELLCKAQPQNVVFELKRNNYHIDFALQICRKYKIIDAIAYLLQKTGSVQEALEMLCQLFFSKLKESQKNFAKTKTIKQEDQAEIIEKLYLIVDLCINSQSHDEAYQSLWYQFLEKFFAENKLRTLTDPKVPLAMRDLLCSIISEVLENMSKHVAIDELLEKLQNKYGPIPLKTFLKTNHSIKQKLEFETFSHRKSIDLTLLTYRSLLDQIKLQMDKGTFILGPCAICQDNLYISVQVIVFNECAHAMHYDCYLEEISKNQTSFNSLKLVSNIQACPLCLQDRTIYLNYLILQNQKKKLGKIESLRGQQSVVAQKSRIQQPGPPKEDKQLAKHKFKLKKLDQLHKHDIKISNKVDQGISPFIFQ